ncbi:MAG: response regulator [Chloroflexota bacterium]
MTEIILYIEDNDDMGTLLVRRLRRMDKLVMVAESGKEGIEMAVHHMPALIFMDYNMPEMNGVEVTRRLKAFPATQTIPIVMLTADNSVETRAAALAAGCDAFLTKPVKREELEGILNQLL